MSDLRFIVNTVLEQQKQSLAPSTFEMRKNYLNGLLTYAEDIGVAEPSQELFDAYVARANTQDLKFQLYHAVKLVDSIAGTKAFRPDGKLYNEPAMPSGDESKKIFECLSFPIEDGAVDIGHLIHFSEEKMEPLQLSESTRWQYTQAWRELYTFLYLNKGTIYVRSNCMSFSEDAEQLAKEGKLSEWKRKIRRRAVNILLEVADTGTFEWKVFKKATMVCPDESLEELRQCYLGELREKNLERNTIDLYDYSFRLMVNSLQINDVSDLKSVNPERIQSMLTAVSERLSLNSRGTIFPIIRQILSYLYGKGILPNDFSGMVLTPSYQNSHLKPYLTEEDEAKLFQEMNAAPLRTNAMMRLAFRLGLRDVDICSLRFEHIDWEQDKIIIEQEKTGVPLCLPLLEDVGNAIMDYIINERPSAAKGCPFVFVREQAPYKELSSLYKDFSALVDKAGVKTANKSSRGVHVGRYTLTHKLLRNKIPHQVITDTLGHVSKESDKPYLSMEEQMLRECPLDLSLIGQKHWKEGDLYE